MVDFKLQVSWIDAAWAQWELLTNDPKYIDIVKEVDSKLALASQDKGKGKGDRQVS